MSDYTPAEVLAAHSLEWIGHQCTCGERFQTGKTYRDGMGDLRRMHAAHVLNELAQAGHVVVKLPEAHDIRVTAINTMPELDDPEDTYGPRIECRFQDIPKPGRLFDRTKLAAALLAAAAAEAGAR